MFDIHQSPNYAQFMQDIGWQVEKIGKWQAFVKKFPLIGSLIKIQRIETPVPYKEIEALALKHRAFRTVIEFSSPQSSPSQLDPQPTTHPHNYKLCSSPFLPTKTIQIDLSHPEKEIFNSFSSEKRQAVRRAEKNNIIIKEGTAQDFIYLKRKSLLEKGIFPMKRLVTHRYRLEDIDKAFQDNLNRTPGYIKGVIIPGL